jgi:hypothetical protein
LRERFGYSWALAGFEIVAIAVLVVVLLSREQRGRVYPATCSSKEERVRNRSTVRRHASPRHPVCGLPCACR